MAYKIIVDERERALYSLLQTYESSMASSFTLSKQVLHLGDIVIQKELEETPFLIIERKSLSDLLASIQDGRYKEQSGRLLQASGIEPHDIIYLIEGSTGGLPDAQRQKVYSAMTSILVLKRMSVIRTWSLQESAEWIVRMTDKLSRESSSSISSSSSRAVVPTTLTAIRKNNITQENIGEILLVQVPGISKVTAKAILSTFDNSFKKVLEAIDTNDPRLENIQYSSGGDGKIRRISKGIVSKLKELF